MNTKTVNTTKTLYGGMKYDELTRENIDISELYNLIKNDFTGKIKVIIHTPTTAGINAHISFIDNFTLTRDGSLIRLEGETTKSIFCITDLTSVNYEKMAGRPNISIENMHTELWFK